MWTHRTGPLGGSNLVLALALVASAAGLAQAYPNLPAAAAATRPNIVVILTDDQRVPSLAAMPNVRKLLVDHGVTFTDAYVSNSLCCPSRSANLTGNYSHTTHVYTNAPPYGGEPVFRNTGDDRSTTATWLDPTYRTALIGKYLNYFQDDAAAGYVPPGWDVFKAFAEKTGHYYNYDLTLNGKIKHYGSEPQDYSTTVFQRAAVSFIHQTQGPLFLYFAPFGAHGTARPAPADETSFQGLKSWRPANYNEANVSDKPAWVQNQPRLSVTQQAAGDKFRLDQLRTLRSVDRAVAGIIEALRETGRLHNTLIIFTSDNGIQWGEHRLVGKATGYEESLRVPLVVRYDPLTSQPRTDDHLIVNIDFAPTIADVAGVTAPATDGMSFLPLLTGGPTSWRSAFLMEHIYGPHYSPAPTFCGIHTHRYVYVNYDTGEDELYDLRTDPYENHNLIADPDMGRVLASLKTRLAALCDPLPPTW